MKVGIIGRSEWTFESMRRVEEEGHEITFIVTCKEAPEYKYSSEDFKQFAYEHDIPFLYEPKITVDKIKSLVKTNDTDICISVNYSGIISQSVIEMFPLGILNAHGGDLPKYRGNACQAWAIINGEDQIGLCIHKMIGGELDSGPIINRSYFPININTRIQEVYDWMDDEIPSLMLKALGSLENDPNYMIEKQSTNPADALRCYPRKPEDGRIDWSSNAEDIVRLINASSEPFSGAYTYLEGKKVTIWRAEVIADGEKLCAVDGQILKISESYTDIACGKNKVRINKVDVKKEIAPLSNWITSIRQRLS